MRNDDSADQDDNFESHVDQHGSYHYWWVKSKENPIFCGFLHILANKRSTDRALFIRYM